MSTAEQADQQSIETQVGFAQRWADLYGLQWVQVYRDEGVSGTVPMAERPAGSRLLRDLHDGQVSAIHVYRVDRLARRIWVLLETVREIEAHGGKLVSLTESFDTGTPVGRLLLTLLGAFAEYERESIAERTREGHRRLSREGYWMGGPRPPYGYRLEGRRIIPNELPIPGVAPPLSEAGVVQLAYHLLTEQGYGCYRIADYLNGLGVPTAFTDRGLGGHWTQPILYNLITSSTYRGLRYYGKRSVHAAPRIPQVVPALVTEAQWEKAQATLTANRNHSLPLGARDYLLRGYLVCAVCGRRYMGVTPTGTRSPFYSCSRKQNEKGPRRCPSANVPMAAAEPEVWARVLRFLADPEGAALRQAEPGISPEERGRLEAEVVSLGSLLAEKESERRRVVAVHRRGRIGEAELDRQLDEIEQEEAALRARRREIEERLQESTPPEEVAARAREIAEEVRAEAQVATDYASRRAVLKAVLREILVETRPGGRQGGGTAELVLRWRL